nr:O-glucosyltransferase rumi homolog [Ipomoea batatas]
MQGHHRHGGDRHHSAERFRLHYVGNKPNVIISGVAFIFLLGFFLYIWAAMLGTTETVNEKIVTDTREFPISCFYGKLTRSCPKKYYPPDFHIPPETPPDIAYNCPQYFRWIYEDLKPWRETGITLEMVERANQTANFRLVILNGRAYVETYKQAFQTRDVFTLWGILQLLRRYPGRVADLDLMFDCVDWPIIKSSDYRGQNSPAPPPLFRYCGDDETLDIAFPDWSFWGWPEINLRPWDDLLNDLSAGNRKSAWIDREPYAYWKGNPDVTEKRMKFLKCNVSDNQDWNARLYTLDWDKATEQGFNNTDLTEQCKHRYKIYIEGSAWSVSQKNILACNSVTLLVKPRYYEFFSRSLMPIKHYWPIRDDNTCRSIKFAVDWGNSHKKKAQEIGNAASAFVEEDLKMDYVYDYMFHLLNQYAKLLRYKPSIPENAKELCSEVIACTADGLQKDFMLESFASGPKITNPCFLPIPFYESELDSLLRQKASTIQQVEHWEKKYWENQEPKT